MGPTNVALVKLFEADQAYRQAQQKLEAASRGVRIQERKVRDLTEKLQASQAELAQYKAVVSDLDMDVKTREEHITKLREKQQDTRTDKEYKAYTIEISTQKLDKAKKEDEQLKAMEQVEKNEALAKELAVLLTAEQGNLQQIRTEIGDRLAAIQQEIDQLKPARDAAAAALPEHAVRMFDRLAERFDGEAMAALGKPDKRVEEYICEACNMSLVTDVYNRLHLRDDLVPCPSCRRILFLREDMTPDLAVNTDSQRKSKKEKKAADTADHDAASQDVAAH